jgi:amino acid transporter
MLGTVLSCLFIGVLSAIEVYVAQLAWPYRNPFAESIVDTAYVHVAMRIGGKFLFHLLNATLLIANMGSGIAAQFGAARLLYGMGRSNALPKSIFGKLSTRTAIPRNNVLLVGACTLLGAFLLTYEKGAELLNFGAFIAFMGVNLAALLHYKFRSQERVPFAALAPLLGLIVSAFIWIHLARNAQILGTTWIIIGLSLFWLMRSRHGSEAGPSTSMDDLDA